MYRERRKRSIFEIMSEYMENLEALADEMLESAAPERPSWDTQSCCFEPLCNIFVTTDEVVVTADLPYAQPETVEVEAVGENLIEISAKMKHKVKFGDFGISHREGEFSSFRSRAHIPVPVETKRMKIHFKRGILEVHLPRKKGYRIRIE
ncbi:MAG: Hsp20/alpha crystallin family protein [Candidatus Bathyarchaeota archaeon]|nr:Hsp20/alpha crystallin family protein [Candidatus Bathyarchaeota archaeon]